MHLVADAKFNLKGSFEISKKDVNTGKVIKYPKQHNLILNNAKTAILLAQYKYGIGIVLGTGSIAPNASDTQLTSPTWGSGAGSYAFDCADGTYYYYIANQGWRASTRSVTWSSDFKTVTFVHRVIIAADAAFVGTIAEIGLTSLNNSQYARSDGLIMTHALLEDAEGNPYTITKTDTEQLTIDYTISLSSNSPYTFLMFAMDSYIKGLFSVEAGTSYSRVTFHIQPVKPLIKNGVCFTRTLYRGICWAVGWHFDGQNRISSMQEIYTSYKMISDVYRLPRSWGGNGHFIHAISALTEDRNRLPIVFNFPDAAIFPIRTLTDLAVGSGDGSTQDFNPPLPMWVENTEKIYVDGVQLTRNVDYTCDHYNNISDNIELYPSFFMHVVDCSNWITQDPSGIRISEIYLADNNINNDWNNTALTERIFPSKLQGSSFLKAYIKNAGDYFVFEIPYDDFNIDPSVDTIYLCAAGGVTYAGLKVEGSNDAINWDLIAASANVTSHQPTVSAKSYWGKTELNASVSYRYWKVSLINDIYGRDYNYLGILLRRQGRPIHFNTAPAAGAIITMDADIDRPWKTSDYILDASITVQA